MNKNMRIIFLFLAYSLALPQTLHAQGTETTLKEKLVQYQIAIASTAAVTAAIIIAALGIRRYQNKKNNSESNGNGGKPRKSKPTGDDAGKKPKKEKKKKKEPTNQLPADDSLQTSQSQTSENQPSSQTSGDASGTKTPAESTSKGTGLKVRSVGETEPVKPHRRRINSIWSTSSPIASTTDDKHHSAPAPSTMTPPIDHRGNTFVDPQPTKKTEGLVPSYQPNSHMSAPVAPAATGKSYSTQSIGRATTQLALKELQESMAQQAAAEQQATPQSESGDDKRHSEIDDLMQKFKEAQKEKDDATMVVHSNGKEEQEEHEKKEDEEKAKKDASVIAHAQTPVSDISLSKAKVESFMKEFEDSLEKNNSEDFLNTTKKEDGDIEKAFKENPTLKTFVEEIQNLMTQIKTLEDQRSKLPSTNKLTKDQKAAISKKAKDLQVDLETARKKKKDAKRKLKNTILAFLTTDPIDPDNLRREQ